MPARYGKRIRNLVRKAEKNTKSRYKCPLCSRIAVRRFSSGVWKCHKCDRKFASGAYEFG